MFEKNIQKCVLIIQLKIIDSSFYNINKSFEKYIDFENIYGIIIIIIIY